MSVSKHDVDRLVLMHHGIRGQRWGVKNGPPYPLNQETHNQVVEGKTGDGGSSNSGASNDSKTRGLVPEAIAIATVATASFVISKIKRNKMNKQFYQTANLYDNATAGKYKSDRDSASVDPETGLLKKSREMTEEEDLVRVNPYYLYGMPFQINCTKCTAAMELRLRGYEVCADKMYKPHPPGIPIEESDTWFVNKDGSKATTNGMTFKFKGLSLDNQKNYINSVVDNVVAQGDGARGELSLWWIGGGGHSVMYRVSNGEMYILDAQNGSKYEGSKMRDILGNASKCGVKRLDNLEINIDALKTSKVVK